MEKAISWGYKEYPWLINDLNFDGLQKDERFLNLMESMKRDWEENVNRYESQ